MDAQAALTALFDAVFLGFGTLLIMEFVAGLIHPSQQRQEGTQNQTQVSEEGHQELPLAPCFGTFHEDTEWSQAQSEFEDYLEQMIVASDWLVVEGYNCYSEFSIRELKRIASRKHVKGYGDMKKSDLVQALLAS